MNAIQTAERMIARNQMRAHVDEQNDRRVWLEREINTRLNIVTVTAIANKQSDGIKASMRCYKPSRCAMSRCGECGR